MWLRILVEFVVVLHFSFAQGTREKFVWVAIIDEIDLMEIHAKNPPFKDKNLFFHCILLVAKVKHFSKEPQVFFFWKKIS